MPTIVVEGYGSCEVSPDRRLVLAIQDDCGVDILHRCGSYAQCTTCRVEFLSGEPRRMSVAERDKLTEIGMLGQIRLSCQILCTIDMHVRPLMTMTSTGLDDPGPQPEEYITPEPEWVDFPGG
jgi:ferredoxin